MKFCVCSIVTNTWNFPELFNRVMALIDFKTSIFLNNLRNNELEIMNGF